MTLTVRGDRATKRLRLVREERRCVLLYFYYVDRHFGLMHIRLQTWLPLTVQVYVNGRAWLARQLTAAGLVFEQHDNALIPRDVDPDAGHQRSAASLGLGTVADAVHHSCQSLDRWPGRPVPRLLLERARGEFATDVIFATPADLQAIYPPRLLHHAIEHFTTGDLLRLPWDGWCPDDFKARPTARWSIGPKGFGSATGSMKIPSECTTKRRVCCAWK